MQQLTLDFGPASVPTLCNFVPTGNEAVLAHVGQQVQDLAAEPPLAHSPAAGHAPSCGPAYPTYIWGPPGSGKSHLLRAVALALQQRGLGVGWLDPSRSVAQPFEDGWSAVLLDDCHAYDAAQQAVAFNWLVNALTPLDGRPKWVLAAGSVPPADLPLRDDVRSRLAWGAVFGLQVLPESERRRVLREAAHARGLKLSEELMDHLLNRFSRDLTSLMRLLDALDAHALRTQKPLSIALVKSMLEHA